MTLEPTESRIPEPPKNVPLPGNESLLAPPLPETIREGTSHAHQEARLSNSDLILVSRSNIRWYYLILLITAVSCFLLGSLVNRREPNQPKTPAKAVEGSERVLLSGQIRYGRVNGLPIPDSGAVVIVLPANVTPGRRIPIEGLRPWDRDSAVAQINRERVAEFGTAWTQATEDGSYNLVLPRPGQYWVLMISKNLARSKAALELTNRGIPELDFRQLSQYFERPADLIGSQAYRWSLETIPSTGLTLNHDFQTDAELGIPELP